MPRPAAVFLPSSHYASLTRQAAPVRNSNSYSYCPKRSAHRKCYSFSSRRWFSQVKPKPLARLHESPQRDFDEVFSRVSSSSSSTSSTLPSTNNSIGRVLNNGSSGPDSDSDSDSGSGTRAIGGGDHKPPDERVIKLGRTLRKLSPLLPTILINALPSELLSPHITLHLFPSTHPHLPNVKGRVLYRAALWTVPVAWSSLPLLGNVRLQILSERMVRADSVLGCEYSADCGEERLVVRWKTEARGGSNQNTTTSSSNTFNNGGASDSFSSLSSASVTALPDNSHPNNNNNDRYDKSNNYNMTASKNNNNNKSLSTLLGGETPIFSPGKEGRFEGLFIFAFDDEGRIAAHTIEHADQADGWDRTAKFVTLTDWLLGKARGTLVDHPALAAQGHPHSYSRIDGGYRHHDHDHDHDHLHHHHHHYNRPYDQGMVVAALEQRDMYSGGRFVSR